MKNSAELASRNRNSLTLEPKSKKATHLLESTADFDLHYCTNMMKIQISTNTITIFSVENITVMLLEMYCLETIKQFKHITLFLYLDVVLIEKQH